MGAPKASHRTDVFVAFLPQDAPAKKVAGVPDGALNAAAKTALKAGEFAGKANETLLLHGGERGRRLLLVGLGEDATAETWRLAAAQAARAIEARRLTRATFLVPPRASGRDIVLGVGLAQYRFDEFKSDAKPVAFQRAEIAPLTGAAGRLGKEVKEGAALVAAVSFARDLGNRPGNVATPRHLATQASKLTTTGLKVKVHDRAALKRLKMGAFLAVAAGSRNEPRLIEMQYRGAKSKETIAIVGKGVTFDTGGISIKPSATMEDMKFDMCGGAAVLGFMHIVAALKPKVNINAYVPATDNMPDGAAYRPGDIVKARNGKTIEIINTDAEGRLLLCDSLAYAVEKKPAAVINLATLTGACVVALGDAAAGRFGNDKKLSAAVDAAGESSGETVWPLPVFDRYGEMMKSKYADLKNSGGRWGGASTAAAFLKAFVGETPWVHLDIAGMAWADGDKGYHKPGATGYGVRLLWEFIQSR